jgi:hypothetical protein
MHIKTIFLLERAKTLPKISATAVGPLSLIHSINSVNLDLIQNLIMKYKQIFYSEKLRNLDVNFTWS